MNTRSDLYKPSHWTTCDTTDSHTACTWTWGGCGGLGATSGFFLLITEELLLLRLGVRQSRGCCFELWDTSDAESSNTSPPMADRQLWSELPKRLMPSADDSVLPTKSQREHLLFQSHFLYIDSKCRSGQPCYAFLWFWCSTMIGRVVCEWWGRSCMAPYFQLLGQSAWTL